MVQFIANRKFPDVTKLFSLHCLLRIWVRGIQMAIGQLGSTARRVLAMGSGRWAVIPSLATLLCGLGQVTSPLWASVS